MVATLDEAWSTSASIASGRRQAPGAKRRLQQQQQQQQQQQRPQQQRAVRTTAGAPSASCGLPRRTNASSSSPLCDLYEQGYSPDVGEAMHERTQVAPKGVPFADTARVRRPSGPLQQPADPALELEPEGFNFVQDPVSASMALDDGEVDFFAEWDAEEQTQSQAQAYYEGFDEPSAPPPPPPHPSLPPQTPTTKPPPPPPPRVREQLQQQQQQQPYEYPVDGTAYAMDVGLYVVSGIMLIFLMEQFIQIGVRLR
jgi:hypothetical protein